MGVNICVIPDVQAKPGNDFAFLTRVGKYIAAKRPDKIVQIGDFADMESLSSYDKGTRKFEGRRYRKDIDASKRAMDALMTPIAREPGYDPEKDLTLGNHEERTHRAINHQPELYGLMDINDLGYKDYGWKVHPFLKPINRNGVMFAHYFVTGVMGRPFTTPQAMLRKMHMSAIAGHQQGRQIATDRRADGSMISAIIAGSCLTPDHQVLTADLRYVPLGEIKPGDKLVSFDEHSGDRSRRFKTGTVEAVKIEPDDVFLVTLESGKQFRATADHLWLTVNGSGYKWMRTDQLVCHGPHLRSTVARPLAHWEPAQSFEAGWLAGMRAKDRDVHALRLTGGATEIARALGALRPTRLLPKFRPEMLGRIACDGGRRDGVVSVVPAGRSEVVRIAIDAKTMIVDGYAHHNCYEHNEDYLGPQANRHWRGIVMLHDVKDGAFDEMSVSLDYLKRKFS